MKTLTAVLEAQAAVNAKAAELTAAKALVERLAKELDEARAAVYQARADADASLPQCTLMKRVWSRSPLEDAGRLVIERKTPAGRLVVRRVGEQAGPTAWMFAWNPHSGTYIEKVSRGSSWVRTHLELRDVPPEFMPAQQVAA
jgi:hypothetical protein